MSLSLLLLFIPACFALNAAPGPNNLLAFSNAARLGVGPALLGGLGRMPAFAGMILLVALGLGALLIASETAFLAVKYAGAAYLIYIGIRMWRTKVSQIATPDPRGDHWRVLAQRDFLIAIGNPKAIAIFTAFFPQFLSFDAPLAPQFLVLGGLFLLMECFAVALYVGLGRMFGRVFQKPQRLRRLNQGVGGFLVFSGVALLLDRKA